MEKLSFHWCIIDITLYGEHQILELLFLFLVFIFCSHEIESSVYCGQYDLLDKMMDFGYLQYTEAKILGEFIKTDAYKTEVTQRSLMAVTNAVS